MGDTVPALIECGCMKVQQDETCPVGYPSLLCDECDGRGLVPFPSDGREYVVVKVEGVTTLNPEDFTFTQEPPHD